MAPTDPDSQKRYRLARKYGITLEDYNEILSEQDGLCAICKRPPAKKGLNLDHCHKTGDVRGLLCYSCNYGLPWFKDNPKHLRSAADYLEANRWEEVNQRRSNRKTSRRRKKKTSTQKAKKTDEKS